MTNLFKRQHAGVFNITQRKLADPAEGQPRISGNAVPLTLPVKDGLSGVVYDCFGFAHRTKNITMVKTRQPKIAL